MWGVSYASVYGVDVECWDVAMEVGADGSV